MATPVFNKEDMLQFPNNLDIDIIKMTPSILTTSLQFPNNLDIDIIGYTPKSFYYQLQFPNNLDIDIITEYG